MRIVKMMSGWASLALILVMFLPMCILTAVARRLPNELGLKLFVISITWFFLVLIFFTVYYRVRRKRAGKYNLKLEGPYLRLFQGGRIIKDFNLAESHKLLILIKDFVDRKALFFHRFADAYLSQGSDRFSFRLFLIMKDAKEAPPKGEETWLSCALDQKMVGNRLFLWITSNPHLSQCQWEGYYTGKAALNFLKALDSFSENNVLLPDVERAKAGGMSLREIKRKALG